MEEAQAINFLQFFSVITIGDNKIPNHTWKECQSKRLTEEQFITNFRKPTTKGIGIVTGFESLEVVDVDTKVFSTQLEKDQFWKEYYQTLKDNILDFDLKFSVYITQSGGYHILYKSKRVVGNTKIAKLKGHKEALIESRGTGGYVFVYPGKKFENTINYFKLQFITDEDRATLWNVSAAYNHIDKAPEEPKKEKKTYQEDEITPWQDYNDKTDIWSVIQDDFFIPTNGQKKNHYLIKRHGSTSAHSGSVFKDSGCMYLFSTGTNYPHEQLISPFVAYAHKNHNGDFKLATKDLYEQGFGSRLKKDIDKDKPKIDKPLPIKDIVFPLDIFPEPIQYYLLQCNKKLDANIDYMGCSLMWLISVCVGNTFEIEVKKGWTEPAVIWLAVVGRAGIGKTPSIDNIIKPLNVLNFKEIKRYSDQMEVYNYYNDLTKKEKEEHPEPAKPKKSQFIANDITLEALVDLHQESDNSVGVFKDELAGWFKDMNKYRPGSDLEFWLSCWSSKSVSVNRMTRKGSFIESPFIPVLGGIQPSIFNQFSTDENKDNGFLDRMLLSFPDAKVEEYNENEMHIEEILWYSNTITRFYQVFKGSLLKRDLDNKIITTTVKFKQEAKEEWKRIFNKITKEQNNDAENEYLKSMYPKQKSYIPRFALLIHLFSSNFDDKVNVLEITKESILKAERLSDYFIMNAKKIKIEAAELKDIKTAMKGAESTYDKLLAIYKADSTFNRTKVAEQLGVSRQQVINLTKKIEAK